MTTRNDDRLQIRDTISDRTIPYLVVLQSKLPTKGLTIFETFDSIPSIFLEEKSKITVTCYSCIKKEEIYVAFDSYLSNTSDTMIHFFYASNSKCFSYVLLNNLNDIVSISYISQNTTQHVSNTFSTYHPTCILMTNIYNDLASFSDRRLSTAENAL